jgi:hypothetical protein
MYIYIYIYIYIYTPTSVSVTGCLRTVCIVKWLFLHSVFISKLHVHRAHLRSAFAYSSTDTVPEMLPNFHFKHDKMRTKSEEWMIPNVLCRHKNPIGFYCLQFTTELCTVRKYAWVWTYVTPLNERCLLPSLQPCDVISRQLFCITRIMFLLAFYS